jgi:hypothetical protein
MDASTCGSSIGPCTVPAIVPSPPSRELVVGLSAARAKLQPMRSSSEKSSLRMFIRKSVTTPSIFSVPAKLTCDASVSSSARLNVTTPLSSEKSVRPETVSDTARSRTRRALRQTRGAFARAAEHLVLVPAIGEIAGRGAAQSSVVNAPVGEERLDSML